MKSMVIIFIALLSFSSQATTNDLECVAAISNTEITRPAHFNYNEVNNSYEAYRATMATGGISFYAKMLGSKVQLVMSRDLMDRMEIIASKILDSREELTLSIDLEEGHTASMSCFKND